MSRFWTVKIYRKIGRDGAEARLDRPSYLVDSRSHCGRGGTGRRNGLGSARVPGGKLPVQNRSNSGNPDLGNPEPSPLSGEGVETRRAAPKAAASGGRRQGEGIVQTTNPAATAGAAKAVAGKKIRRAKARAGSSPAARTSSWPSVAAVCDGSIRVVVPRKREQRHSQSGGISFTIRTYLHNTTE